MSNSNPEHAEVVSAEFDSGQLDSRSSHSIQSPDDLRLVRDWQLLGDYLRRIPVRSVDLANSVQQQVAYDTVGSGVKSRAIQRENRSRTLAVVSSTIALIVVCVCMFRISVGPRPMPGNQLSGVTPEIIADGLMQCRVVLITIPESDQNMADVLMNSFDEYGVRVQPVAFDSMKSGRNSSTVFSSDALPDDVLNALSATNANMETEWNPDRIGDWDCDELLGRFVKSLQSPTQSEKHFGEMVVVLPSEVLESIKQRLSAEQVAAIDSLGIREATESTVGRPERVVVVVRRKRSTSDASLPDKRQGFFRHKNLGRPLSTNEV